MLRLTEILGQASEARLAERLHRLEHRGRVERIILGVEDTLRHRLRLKTDHGTDCAIALPRQERLSDGAVLYLDEERGIVVQVTEQAWLGLGARDLESALELGYLAGNMHWTVRFRGPTLLIALRGPEQDYLDRLAPLLASGRVRKADHV